MDKSYYEDRHFKSAGHIHDDLKFRPGRSRCGHIRDGVSFEHGSEGCWVIAYDDLIEMARLATEAREKKGSRTKAPTKANQEGENPHA